MRNWKITLAAAWVAQFLCIVGFNAVGPFYPFYIRALGVTDVHQVTLWAGILASTGAVSMALMSPIWGVLADRHGRKIMVVRATFGGALVLGAMALVQSVQQLFILRLLQGMLTGTVSAFMTLIASIAPAGEVGFALGMMQMAVFGGASVGPLVGGLVADNLGYRWVFGVTGILLFAGDCCPCSSSASSSRRPRASRTTVCGPVCTPSRTACPCWGPSWPWPACP
ncbi:MAG: MFS transporter [Anaerolineae bacterium]|nr:MFS transporter [Anaerolineae bacterium]